MKRYSNLFTCLCLITAFFFLELSINPAIAESKEKKFKKIPKQQRMFFNAHWEYLKTRNPATLEVPSSIKEQEMQFVKKSQADIFANSLNKNKDGLQANQWISRGPTNIQGRTLGIGIDIRNPQILNVATASGGVWRSMDAGQNWVKTSELSQVQVASCIVQDKRQGKNDIWYYGTGELLSTTDRKVSNQPRTVGIGNGIYKSTDNGSTWSHLKSTACGDKYILKDVFQGIWNIVIDPKILNMDVVLAACHGAIMRSTDGGNTWSKVLGNLETKAFSTYIDIADDGTFYASMGGFTVCSPGNLLKPRVYRSTDGINWDDITPDNLPEDVRMAKLSVFAKNSNIVYFLAEIPITDDDYSLGFSASEHKFYKGTYNPQNKQIKWEDNSINLPGGGTGNIDEGAEDSIHGAFNTIGGYCMAIKVHPVDSDIVFIGGTNMYRNTTGFADSTKNVYMGGYPYDGITVNLHPDQHCFAFSPDNPNIMYVTCDGGVYRTNNPLTYPVKWDIVSRGIVNTQFYWTGLDPEGFKDEFISGGVQDNATYITDRIFPPEIWDIVLGGDGMTTLISNNKEYLLMSVYNDNIFTFFVDSKGMVSNINYQRPDTIQDENCIFYTNYVLDRNDNKYFYMPANNWIWRQEDMKALANDTSLLNVGWKEITKGRIPDVNLISAISLSVKPAHILYAGTYNGFLYRIENSKDTIPSLTDITSEIFPKGAFLSSICIDPDDAAKVLISFSSYQVKSIFYTTNSGTDWIDISGNLEEFQDGAGGGPSVRFLNMLKYNGKTVYFAATSSGLFTATVLNGNRTVWTLESPDVIGSPIIDMIDTRQKDGFVVISTQGSGVFSSYYTDISGATKDIPEYFTLMKNSPNPADNFTDIGFTLPDETSVKLELADIRGKTIDKIADGKKSAGFHNIRYDCSHLSSGAYFIKLNAGEKSYIQRMMISR